ncbi:cobalamin biosynthesis protein [uncultured Thiocystis sp.]|jgi:cobalt-precorrin 5A hydrolase|uniref:cobalt-precorrin 5A hydrolase n=1 Tax=uncultured Thiocystis sp. TaxID=1202134 RepID=UPI0025E7A635|nr:cobalamin biosynthesis protein [uncultured Thiocystis sp.]
MTQQPCLDADLRARHPDRIAVLAITRDGIALGGRILGAMPGTHLFAPESFRRPAEPGSIRWYGNPTRELIPLLLAEFDALIAILSLGALVRLIAPHLRDKYRDPAVVALDAAGRFAIPVLSGHLGGANALAARLATALGATPVITTASDVQQTLAVDLLGRELGWTLDASPEDLLRASAAMVNGEPVALIQEAGSPGWWPGHANGRSGPLPDNLHCLASLDRLPLEPYRAVLWISHRLLPRLAGFAGPVIIYRPGCDASPTTGAPEAPRPSGEGDTEAILTRRPVNGMSASASPRLSLGLGCDRGTSVATLEHAVAEALAAIGADPAQVARVASIDLKADEPGLAALAERHRWVIRFYSAEQLAPMRVPNPSETVRRHTGTPSVSEAAALLAAGADAGDLLLEKHKIEDADGKHATVSIARIVHD